MTTVKALVNAGGGRVGSALVLTEDDELIVRQGKQEIARFALEADAITLVPGAPGKPAEIQLLKEPAILKVQYVGHELDDFFFVLHQQLKGRRQQSNARFFGLSDASWSARLLRSGSDLPAEIFGPFFRLADASAVLHLRPSLRLQMWSRESDKAGSRVFYLASYDEFWRHYSALKNEDRNYYEVIPGNVPAKLYLDVEYAKAMNATVNGNAVMEHLIRHLTDFLRLSFSHLHGVCHEIIDLESHYEHKFSRHVIFPAIVFVDNLAMGEFVAAFHDYLRLRLDQESVQMLFVVSDKSESVFVCDMGVYNRNRNFRLAYSSKASKHSFLLPIDRKSDGPLDRNLFMSSLVCNVANETTRLLELPPSTGENAFFS